MAFQHDGKLANGKILLNPHRSQNAGMGTLAHELRHVLQEKSGLAPEIDAQRNFRPLADPLTFFRFSRIAEADATTQQSEFLYDLVKTTGHKFSHGSQNEDLATVFEQQLDTTGGDRNKARLAVFQKVMGALDTYDHDTLDFIRRNLQLKKQRTLADPLYNERPPLELTAPNLRKFGQRPDGENYLASLPDDALLKPEFFGAIKPETLFALEQVEKITSKNIRVTP